MSQGPPSTLPCPACGALLIMAAEYSDGPDEDNTISFSHERDGVCGVNTVTLWLDEGGLANLGLQALLLKLNRRKAT